MKIHEFQGKTLFRKFSVPVPDGFVARTPDETREAALKMGGGAVIKSQIHAGGRGRGKIYNKNDRNQLVLDGGVKIAKSADEARDLARKILGNILVTRQTGSQGKEVRALLVEKTCKIKHEYYVGMTLDRASSRITLMASTEGGIEIEDVAAKSPEKILKIAVDPAVGFEPYQGRVLAYSLGLEKEVATKFGNFCAALCRMYQELDCSLVEINPLVLTEDFELLALDAKINFDENALYRHPELAELRDYSEEDPLEIEAKSHDLSYISLSGNIGCMVNGAGLAMATMDIIKLNGGSPANFLDVGGGASQEKVTTAFKIILKDPDVRAILVNIFGGIMRCDVIANGIVAAVGELGLKLPLVVRLQGTNADIGRKVLAESGFRIIPAETMDEAAGKVVVASRS